MQQSEYVNAAISVIQSILVPSPRKQATAAYVANQIRTRIPAASWQSFGFHSFKDFASALEQAAGFKLGINEKQALTLIMPQAGIEQPAPIDPITSPRLYNRLLDQVWLAFVSKTTFGFRYLNKMNGTVLMDVENPPPPVDEWAQIDPIDAEIQKGWARQFLSKEGIDDPLVQSSIESGNWYVDFPAALLGARRRLNQEWNKHRSEKVSEIVHKWCKENGVNTGLAFTKRVWTQNGNFKDGPITKPISSETRNFRDQDKNVGLQRKLIEIALWAMSTEELLQLPIPAKYMVSAMTQLERIRG